MNKQSHTPGPWKVDSDGTTVMCPMNLPVSIGTVFEEAGANAHLIAAAPEMLKVLHHLAYICERNDGGSLDLGTWEVEMIEKVIAKARGES